MPDPAKMLETFQTLESDYAKLLDLYVMSLRAALRAQHFQKSAEEALDPATFARVRRRSIDTMEPVVLDAKFLGPRARRMEDSRE